MVLVSTTFNFLNQGLVLFIIGRVGSQILVVCSLSPYTDMTAKKSRKDQGRFLSKIHAYCIDQVDKLYFFFFSQTQIHICLAILFKLNFYREN